MTALGLTCCAAPLLRRSRQMKGSAYILYSHVVICWWDAIESARKPQDLVQHQTYVSIVDGV